MSALERRRNGGKDMSGNHELNIGFIGFGNMAQAIAEGLILKGAAAADRIYACAKNQEIGRAHV